MNTIAHHQIRPQRRWFVIMSIGIHLLGLVMLVWWLMPVITPSQERITATLNITLAPSKNESAQALAEPVSPSLAVLAATKSAPGQNRVSAQPFDRATATPVTQTTATMPPAKAPHSRSLYTQLLASSRELMVGEFSISPPSKTQQLTALLNEPSTDHTLVGQLYSERNWAGSQETLVVFNTAFGHLCARYTNAEPLDSLDQGHWRMMIRGCYKGS